MLKTFRLTAILEGVSYLSLFGFSMPLKYWAKIPEPNIYIGYATWLLVFIVFVVLAILSSAGRTSGGYKRLIILFVASLLLPFGTFYIDKKYLSLFRPQINNLEPTGD